MATPAWHNLGIPEIYQQLKAHPEGLTAAEVTDRLAQHGRNEIIRRKPVSPWKLLFKQFVNYFILVLLFAAILAFAVSFLPGESGRRLTAYFILGIIVLSVVLNFFEEIPRPEGTGGPGQAAGIQNHCSTGGYSSTN